MPTFGALLAHKITSPILYHLLFCKPLFEHHFKSIPASEHQPYHERYAQAAYNLYQKLIAPVKKGLSGIDKLIIVPDGKLGYIPFDALLTERPRDARKFKDHHYLLNDYQISYAYSATLLLEMQQKQNRPTRKLLAFAPAFPQNKDLADNRRAGLDTLLHNIPEAEAIHSLAGGDIYTGEQATEELFWSLAGQYQILHLATHGKMDDRVGDYCYLAFTPFGDSLGGYKLHVRDLYNLSLNADMVVLSACETGIGELQRGEGILSLARGFAYAGAKSIINTLWSVNDRSSKDLMKEFYRQLKRGKSKDEALRQAKLEYLRGAPVAEASPYYWAAFIPVGDMAPLELWSVWDYKWWIIGGLALVIGFFFWRRRSS